MTPAPDRQAPDGACGIELTAYYNGACPVCRAEMGHYKKISREEGLPLAWCDLSRDAYIAERLGLDREAMKRRLHVVDRQGRLHIGVAAFAAIWRELPRYRWAARLIQLPLIRPLSAFFYDQVLARGLYLWNRWRERHMANA